MLPTGVNIGKLLEFLKAPETRKKMAMKKSMKKRQRTAGLPRTWADNVVILFFLC